MPTQDKIEVEAITTQHESSNLAWKLETEVFGRIWKLFCLKFRLFYLPTADKVKATAGYNFELLIRDTNIFVMQKRIRISIRWLYFDGYNSIYNKTIW